MIRKKGKRQRSKKAIRKKRASLIVDHIWTTAAGKQLLISKMSDDHLLNAYGMCVRREKRMNTWAGILRRELLRRIPPDAFDEPIIPFSHHDFDTSDNAPF